MVGVFAIVSSTVSIAGLDRSGNVLYEEDGGGSGRMGVGDIVPLFLVWTVAAYGIVRILRAKTKFSDELIYNIAFFGGAFISLFVAIA